MPSKYVVHTKKVPNRFLAVPRSGIIAWEEGCLKCAECVKKHCVYNVYDKRGLDGRQMLDSIDVNCMNCLRCVQNCPMELIHKSLNPEYKALGDDYWTPEIIVKIYYQAETGKIPVSGAGYAGPFTGPGFDSMWTDMSEIVRPTRDGIHGREYISTAIDLGRTAPSLSFDEEGGLTGSPRLVGIPLPIIFRHPPFGSISRKTIEGWARGAKELGTLYAVPETLLTDELLGGHRERIIPVAQGPEGVENLLKGGFPLVEASFEEVGFTAASHIFEEAGDTDIIITLPIKEGIADTAHTLAREGAAILHLAADEHGKSLESELFIKEAIQEVHGRLVEEGIRDEITILASGGLAMAEHAAKAIICGADGVFVSVATLIALECHVCRRCERGLSCPVDVQEAEPDWVAARVKNLMGAWHNQLLEVMGAMGIRDARRLRGESGRAMFFEDLDREIFGSLGVVKEGAELV